MRISMIAAMGPNREIGKDNKLLWHIKEDLQNFKNITSGKSIVMGRKTFESIGKLLPNRENIIITRDENFKIDGALVLNDPLMLLDYILEKEELTGLEQEVMIIGGSQIYDIFLPYAQTLYLSYVNYDGDADAFFPEFDASNWDETKSEEFDQFVFKILEKK